MSRKQYTPAPERWPQPQDRPATLTPVQQPVTGSSREKKISPRRRRKLTDNFASWFLSAVAVVMVVNTVAPGPAFRPLDALGFISGITAPSLPENNDTGIWQPGNPVPDVNPDKPAVGDPIMVNGWYYPELGEPFDAALSALLGRNVTAQDYANVQSFSIDTTPGQNTDFSAQIDLDGNVHGISGTLGFEWEPNTYDAQAISWDMQRFTGLRYLNLALLSSISDLSFLQYMPQLQTLKMGYNDITDLSYLAYVPKLSELGLMGNPVEYIPAGLDLNIMELDLSATELKSTEGIAGLVGPLTMSIDISGTKITDLHGFYEFTDADSLYELSCYWTGITSLDGLQVLADSNTISNISAYGCLLTDISALASLNNTPLEHLSLGDNQISDLTPLEGITSLKILSLGANPCQNLTPLSGLVNLQELYLEGCGASDISALAPLVNLIWVNLRDNGITDISAVSAWTSVRDLYLENNSITDLSPLASCERLRNVHLQNNQFTDISVFTTLNWLYYLDVRGNPVADLTPVKQMDLEHFIHD